MHRFSARVALIGGPLALAVAVVVLLSSVLGGDSGALAAGSTPTNTPLPTLPGGTPGPTPTPKSTNQAGNVTGVYDIIVDGGDPAVDLFHCIAFIAHDGSNDDVKIGAQCNDNTGLAGDADAEPLNDATGEGPDFIGPTAVVGPPPPPPYNTAAPFKGSGGYDTGTDTITISACISEIGGLLGPNIIATLTASNATSDLSTTGKLTASVVIHGNQSDADCEAGTPAGTPPDPLAATLYPAYDDARCPSNNCTQSPWRASPLAGGSATDWDGDACTDKAELDKTDGTKCGDDPWNPNDTNLASIDVAGDYTLIATAADEDDTNGPAAGGHVPGLYYTCVANIAQSGKNLTARLSCYIDSPVFVINPQAVASPNQNATLCPPAPADYCGDGSPGSPPPGITVGGGSVRNFGDVDTAIPVFTGMVDNGKNAIIIAGCFADLDGFSGLGNVYATATVDLHTGHGWVLIHQGITSMADCNDGPPFADGIEGYVPIDLVRQTKDAVKRDSDSDRCADRKELANNQATGGLRDPSNHYDYFNPSKDGLNRVDDILAVVNQYFMDDPIGMPDLKSQTDRTALTGGNPWNLGPPNGQQRVDDILASVKQYFHDCNLT